MISKKLLSEVLGVKLAISPYFKIEYINFETLQYYDDFHHGNNRKHINIHELTHKMKAWAWEKGYSIATRYMFDKCSSELWSSDGNDVALKKLVLEKTEFDATARQCEWILRGINHER